MREPVYRKIVFLIKNQRTWIDVVDADMYGVFAFLYRGYACHFTSRFCCFGLISPIIELMLILLGLYRNMLWTGLWLNIAKPTGPLEIKSKSLLTTSGRLMWRKS